LEMSGNREANVGVADALAHAKALARASHPNVVAVHTLDRISDPDTGEVVDCVVMELLEGETLSCHLESNELSVSELQNIGRGIIYGIHHIHEQGMAHGDLHEENVMVVGGNAKIIDILYLNTLLALSTEQKETKLKRDLLSLRLLLQLLIKQSELDPAEATEFNNMIEVGAGILEIEEAFNRITSPENVEDLDRAIEHLYARVTEEAFVEGRDYGEALADETPDFSLLPIFKKLIEERTYNYKHRDYIEIIWARLSSDQKDELLKLLGEAINQETPQGKYSSNLRLLASLGVEGWNGLPRIVRLRLEQLLIRDVLAGHKDIHSVKNVSGGTLGTYSRSLWRRFQKPQDLAENLISLLRQNWYTQNYVGEFFFDILPSIARATGTRDEFIFALKIAVANDARLIVRKMDDLPGDWIEEIRGNGSGI